MSTTERTKVVRLGKTAAGDLFAKIELTPRDREREGLRLSITGVEGPKANGDAKGSCGQVVMSRPALLEYAPGWDAATVERFWQTWNVWHLNDMRVGCEHQRATWHPEAELELVTYRLDSEAMAQQRAITKVALAGLASGHAVSYNADELAVMALPWETKTVPDADASGSGRYTVHTRETKGAGWVYPTEHPGGLLLKPCEVRGYTYGSEWLFEPVPEAVVAFLFSLPDADRAPAWI